MIEAVLAGRGVHGHAADRIKYARGIVAVMVMAMARMVVVGMIVAAAARAILEGGLRRR
jgi:hypothetical protein